MAIKLCSSQFNVTQRPSINIGQHEPQKRLTYRMNQCIEGGRGGGEGRSPGQKGAGDVRKVGVEVAGSRILKVAGSRTRKNYVTLYIIFRNRKSAKPTEIGREPPPPLPLPPQWRTVLKVESDWSGPNALLLRKRLLLDASVFACRHDNKTTEYGDEKRDIQGGFQK